MQGILLLLLFHSSPYLHFHFCSFLTYSILLGNGSARLAHHQLLLRVEAASVYEIIARGEKVLQQVERPRHDLHSSKEQVL